MMALDVEVELPATVDVGPCWTVPEASTMSGAELDFLEEGPLGGREESPLEERRRLCSL